MIDALAICPCVVVPYLDIFMVLVLCGLLLLGFPAAFSLAGTALLFAVIGMAFNVFDVSFLKPFPQRIFGAVTNTTLIAVPLFILMGVILEKSRIAEDLLDAMAKRLPVVGYPLSCEGIEV
ncbi:MAG: TRAP transporter large permease subunit, partial [Pseudomonadota bacterium]